MSQNSMDTFLGLFIGTLDVMDGQPFMKLLCQS